MPATLGGMTILNEGPVSWTLVDGVEPASGVFLLRATDAQSLWAAQAGKPVALQITQSGYQPLLVQSLFVLQLTPGTKLNPDGSPFDLGVLVADERWQWAYQHVGSTYNVLRREGEVFNAVEGEPIQIQLAAPNLQYCPWSLQTNQQPWDAIAMVRDVITQVTATPLTIQSSLATRQQAVKGLEFDHEGHRAIDTALGYLAGAAVTIDATGAVRVRDVRDGSEVPVVNALAPYVAGGPLALVVDHSAERPSAVRVLFQTELEIRLDAVDEDTLLDPDADERVVQNVAPSPDFLLNANGILGAVLAQANGNLGPGAWTPFPLLAAAWQQDPQDAEWQITPQSIRLSYFHPGGPMSLTDLAQGSQLALSPLVEQRIMTAMEHFRLTWQMPRAYLDRISRIYPWRASMQYPGNQQRAPAIAYLPWAVQWQVREIPNMQNPGYMIQNMAGWAPLLANAKVAPFTVSVLDEQQGVLHLTPKGDVYGRTAFIYPGLAWCPTAASPGADPFAAILAGQANEAEGSLAQNAGQFQLTLPRDDPSQPAGSPILVESASLAAGFECAIIVTVVPAAPNDNRRFFCMTITPQQAGAVLDKNLGVCSGPVKTVKVGPDLISARFAWSDQDAASYDSAMGVGLPPLASSGPIGLPGSPLQAGTCIGEPNGPFSAGLVSKALVNKTDVLQVAQAVAASVYSRWIDRMEGGVSVPSAAVALTGNMASITTALAPNGVFTTTVGLPSVAPEVDFLAFLPQSTRRRLGLIIQKRGSTTG